MNDSMCAGQSAWVGRAREVWLPDVAVLVSAPDGTVVRASEQAAELAGEASPAGLVGRQLTELLVPDGAVWRLSGRGVGASLVRTVSWLHDHDAQLQVTVLLDVSDLAVALSRMPFAQRGSVVETGPPTDSAQRDAQRVAQIGTWRWDSKADVIRPSSALRELTGRPSDRQVRFGDYLRSVHPDDRARVREMWASLIRHHHPVEIEHRYVRCDGAVRIFRVHGIATRDADGEVALAGTTQDITEHREAAATARYRSGHDAVTGLPNRAAVHTLLQPLLGHPDAATIAVLACRIDNFKRVITSLGHDAGDDVLVVLARRLADGLGEECTVARVSGEGEFVIVCLDLVAVGGLDALTGRVSGLVQTPVPVREQLIQISASIGAAVHEGASEGVDDLLRFAIAAMGQARQHGLGQVRQAGPTLMASADQQVRVEGQLRDALLQDGLRLHYQPVVAADGSIIAAEALVRWPHPERGLLSPGAFLPVAERGGLLRELDLWVLRTALRAASGWRSVGGRDVDIAVNLTGLVPGDPDFQDLVADAVTGASLDWHRLILELVETELPDARAQSRQDMLRLVQRGARFALDDFGTGHSSLARLKNLPTHILKIDRQFVSGIENDTADRAMTHAMVDMTHALGRQCIAEGVETAGQFRVLTELGVDAYQGWLFAHALPEGEFATLLGHPHLFVPNADM